MECEPLLNAPNSSTGRCGIPSPVTLKELMNRYDALVARLNDRNEIIAEDDQACDWNPEASYQVETYDELVLVCHLLLAPMTHDDMGAGVKIAVTTAATTTIERRTQIPWSTQQRETLLTTGCRAMWLQQQQQRDRRSRKKRKSNGEGQVDPTPDSDLSSFNSLAPTLRVTRFFAPNNKSNEVALEWKLDVAVDESIVATIAAAVTTTTITTSSRRIVDSNDDDDETDNENLLASLSRTEIAAEEELLWRMAHTPIPIIKDTFARGDS